MFHFIFWDRFGSIGCCNWSEWTRPKALTSPTLTSCSIRWFVDKMSIHDMFLPVGYFHWGKRPQKKLLGNFFYFHLRIWKSLPTAKFYQRISPRLVGQKNFILQNPRIRIFYPSKSHGWKHVKFPSLIFIHGKKVVPLTKGVACCFDFCLLRIH